MSQSKFFYTNFFNEVGILTDFMRGFENVWEAIPDIGRFIDEFEIQHEELGYKKHSDAIYVGNNVTIEESAKIDGPAIIGGNTKIGHAAFLRSGVIIGNDVHVGHATEVKHSIVMSHTALAHLNYIGDSIMGNNVNLSGGATLANWRFDKQNVLVKHEDESIDTNMEKFGSIIGDSSFIGVNAVLNPGTILAPDSLVFPLVSVKGAHLKREVFK